MLGLGLNLAMLASGGGGAPVTLTDIVALFGGGEQGYIYDPADSASVFQERTGAPPATATGADEAAGSFKDLSPNANWARAPSDAARPLRKTSGGVWWIEGDGTDDVMRSLFTIAQPIVRIVGWRRLTGASSVMICGGGAANAGALFRSTGTITYGLFSGFALNGPDVALNDDVITVERHSGATSRIKADAGSYTTGDAGTTVPGGVSLLAANTAASFANARIYRVVGINRDLSDAEIANTVEWVAQNMPP